MSKAKTAEDLRVEVIDHIRRIAAYWSEHPEPKTVRERCDGLAFSILNIFDGTTDLPAFDIVARPHPDDKEYDQSNGDDWIEDGTVINDGCMLHEIYYSNHPRSDGHDAR